MSMLCMVGLDVLGGHEGNDGSGKDELPALRNKICSAKGCQRIFTPTGANDPPNLLVLGVVVRAGNSLRAEKGHEWSGKGQSRWHEEENESETLGVAAL